MTAKVTETRDIAPIQRLVVASAGKGATRAGTILALDSECAAIARVAREPMMAQIRLAWWRDGLNAADSAQAHRAPVMDSLRALPDFGAVRASLVAMIDGWEELILWDGMDIAAMLEVYAGGRGAGMFAALAPARAEKAAPWGRIWALWDLSGHVDDEVLARAAVDQGRAVLPAAGRLPVAKLPRMLAMLAGAARHDIAKGRPAPPHLTPGLYMRLLRLQIMGR